MSSMIRSAVAVVTGFLVANLVMVMVVSLNSLLYPEIVKAVESNDPQALGAAVAAPGATGALVVVLAAWVLGSFAGGAVAARIGSHVPFVHALVVGAVFMSGGIANNLAYPPPPWFWAATLFAFLPAAYAGARWGRAA